MVREGRGGGGSGAAKPLIPCSGLFEPSFAKSEPSDQDVQPLRPKPVTRQTQEHFFRLLSAIRHKSLHISYYSHRTMSRQKSYPWEEGEDRAGEGKARGNRDRACRKMPHFVPAKPRKGLRRSIPRRTGRDLRGRSADRLRNDEWFLHFAAGPIKTGSGKRRQPAAFAASYRARISSPTLAWRPSRNSETRKESHSKMALPTRRECIRSAFSQNRSS